MAKPYDRLFKTLAEDDPRGLLHLFGSLPLNVEAEVRALEREVAAPALAVDHVYQVRTAEGEWLEHYEVQTRYRVVKLWEIDPASVLELRRPSLLPWVVLMRPSEEAMRSAAAEITRLGDRKLAAEFVVLGGLRYDKGEVASLLGRLSAMITDEMLEESSFYQMILEKGLERGLEKGLEEGREKGRREGTVEEARSNLKLVLSLRFPGLEDRLELDSIPDRERLEGLLAAVVTAADREGAEAAIRRVVPSE